MSSLLPTESNFAPPVGAVPTTGLPLDGQGDSFDLVSMLLNEQQTLTAVEDFAAAHESGLAEEQMVAPPAGQPAQARYYSKLMPASPPGPGQQLAFDVNLDTCSGCKACVVACHTMNGLDETESWRRVGTLVIGETDDDSATETATIPAAIGVQHITTACHHCEDPGCLNGCPVKAYDKDPETGIVRHLDDQCIGCKYCTMMCPYEVPKYSKRLGIVRKCDMCQQRLATGEAPACVQSCPNEAIAIRVVDQQIPGTNPEDRLISGAPLSSITRPTTVFRSKDPSKRWQGHAQDHGIDRPAEDHWPLAALLIATQVGVGMLLTERVLAAIGWLAGSAMPTETTRWTATVALVISMVGMNLAPLHLGQPLRSWRIFLGLRTSWLSREAVLLGKFVGILTLAVVTMWLPAVAQYLPTWVSIPAWVPGTMLLGAIVFGIAGLLSSGMIYIATKRILWRFDRTMIRFLGTAAIGGMSTSALVIAATTQQRTSVTLLLGLTTLGLSVKLAWEQSILLRRQPGNTDDPWDRRSQRLVRHHLAKWSLGRLALGWTSVTLLVLSAALSLAGSMTLVVACTLAATLLLVTGEFIERLIYFSSVVTDRMPGTLR
ncbi:Molybdopterin oxidoreductase, iron sulfur subunit [Rhodopirellula islandica]|uniref:Molybdopterin oxidoreductase, iron sulfur subunit n=1 Tax=Rhodopirellula islandica TaxID=595434 RepID=A0A0J1BCI0_RHOIS|nr:DmsC/YnfH family molybdoenzyme membrane anchor subunit [Rhodopirellula islandica]KLU04268.1 Molybdopterin oxidoreductase, iron sulfur subunit [Rhodopirellula islandica]